MRQPTSFPIDDVTSHHADAPPLLEPVPPRWVADVMRHGRASVASTRVRAVDAGGLILLSTSVPSADRLDAETLRAEVCAAYVALGDWLAQAGHRAIRLWNYLPNPNHLMAPGLDRYMVFNAGRHDGYRRWFGDPARFGKTLATASAVGTSGDTLVVHCLASVAGGRSIENPRQRPAWRYSERYGPMPPSFSRATVAVIDGRERLLIGGTASILGEDSVHAGDVAAQTGEILENLASLVFAARPTPDPVSLSLSRLTDIRVYLTSAKDAAIVHAILETRCPGLRRIEMAVARLCRPELLVEIEGVADLPHSPSCAFQYG